MTDLTGKQTVRETIVTTASELYYRRGIGSVGMDTVRDEAGVSLRAIYKEFASKEDLVLAVLALRHNQWELGLATKARGITDPVGRLLAVFDYLTDWFAEPTYRGCGFINAFGELGPSSPRITEAVRVHKRSFQEFMGGLVTDAGGPPQLAAQLALLAEGAQTTAAIAGHPGAAADARAAAITLMRAAGIDLPGSLGPSPVHSAGGSPVD